MLDTDTKRRIDTAREYISSRYEVITIPVEMKNVEAGTGKGRIDIEGDVVYR